MSEALVPVTVLTGFLGSGKTTLLNRILTENHGKRIAVIENEFGEIGIDNNLVISADEEIFEMNNGCICCTVRGDLIRILGNLMRRREKFDYIMIETTGLADPAPVAQTFFVDDDMKQKLRLDGVVTLVDARHVWLHIDESSECQEQIAFADVILLNKTDLVTPEQLDQLEQRIRGMNAMARIHRTRDAAIEMEHVLNVGGFDLERALEKKPSFLEPEYPFEWGGAYHLDAGLAELVLQPGPDPTMEVLLLPWRGKGPALEGTTELAARRFSYDALPRGDRGTVRPSEDLVELQLLPRGATTFRIEVDQPGTYVLYAQHQPIEFNAELRQHGVPLTPLEAHVFNPEHEHDDEVTSVGLEASGSVDIKKLNKWFSALLMEKGPDIFRMKGILSVADEERRFVFQGVHMLFDGRPGEPWQADEARGSQLVFIGRNLDRAELEGGFRACLA